MNSKMIDHVAASDGQRKPRSADTHVALLLAIVVAVLALGASCTSDNQGTPDTTGAPSASPLEPSSTPGDPVALAEQQALAAYEGMWSAYDQAGRAPEADPDDERLGMYAADQALETLVDGLTSLRDQDLVIEGEVVLHPEVVELSPPSAPTEVKIEDCGDSSDWLTVHVDTGEVTDLPRGRQLVLATVRDTGGEWKVVSFAVREVGSCGS